MAATLEIFFPTVGAVQRAEVKCAHHHEGRQEPGKTLHHRVQALTSSWVLEETF